jgi:hypothetical protein
MYKALAVLRTVYLLFIVGYTIWAMPFSLASVSRTFDEQYARCSESLHLLTRAAWLAIAWITFETLVGWVLATRSRRAVAAPSSPPREKEKTSGTPSA